jgi:hypothetical protein
LLASSPDEPGHADRIHDCSPHLDRHLAPVERVERELGGDE